MAHSLSAKKRIRQNVRRRMRNRTRKAALKTQIRRYADAIRAGSVQTAEKELRLVVKALDQTAAKRTIHRNAASRRKSRLTRRLNKLMAAAKA